MKTHAVIAVINGQQYDLTEKQKYPYYLTFESGEGWRLDQDCLQYGELYPIASEKDGCRFEIIIDGLTIYKSVGAAST